MGEKENLQVHEEIDENSNVVEESEKRNIEMGIKFFGEIIGHSMEKALKAVNHKDVMGNVAIYIDYDNVYWTLTNSYNHDPDNIDGNKNLFLKLWEKYGQDHIRTFRAYGDFQKLKSNLTSLQKKRVQIRHVYSNGKSDDLRKNSSDIELSIDVIESTYKDPNITCYVIVTADSDMIPILSRLMYKGKRVELYYLSTASPKHINMTDYVHYSEDLIKFLNIDIKEYDVSEYIYEALRFIEKWYTENNKTDYFLGAPYLRGNLSKQLGVPSDIVSELIEKLYINELIFENKKTLSDGSVKTTIDLTHKAKELLIDINNERIGKNNLG